MYLWTTSASQWAKKSNHVPYMQLNLKNPQIQEIAKSYFIRTNVKYISNF